MQEAWGQRAGPGRGPVPLCFLDAAGSLPFLLVYPESLREAPGSLLWCSEVLGEVEREVGERP